MQSRWAHEIHKHVPGVTGKISYDHATKTLTLDNATIPAHSGGEEGIEIHYDNFTIKLKGTNNVSSSWRAAVALKDNLRRLTITSDDGKGVLNVNNSHQDDHGIWLHSGNLVIRDCNVNAEAGRHAIKCENPGGNRFLHLENANVTAKSRGSEGAIWGFDYGVYIKAACELYYPTDAVWKKGEHTYYSGSKRASEVKFTRTYSLYIGNQRVTDQNKGDLKVLSGVTGGSASYDSDKRVLSLNDISIKPSEGEAIYAGAALGSSFTINVSGENKLTTDARRGVRFLGTTTTIEGSGILDVVTTHANGDAIGVDGSTLIIEDCTVKAKGRDCGLYGMGRSTALYIRGNATVSAISTRYGSIYNFKGGIDLGSRYIAKPAGAYSSGGSVLFSNGQPATGEVYICENKSYDLKVYDTRVTDANRGRLARVAGASRGTITFDGDKTITLSNVTVSRGGVRAFGAYNQLEY